MGLALSKLWGEDGGAFLSIPAHPFPCGTPSEGSSQIHTKEVVSSEMLTGRRDKALQPLLVNISSLPLPVCKASCAE